MRELVIVDYGLGNLYSIEQACRHAGGDPVISSDPEVIANAGAVILPGVGAFQVAMDHLKSKNLVNVLVDFAKSGKPLMGICLGMQLLFDRSEEFGVHSGLGLIKGSIRKFPAKFNDHQLRIPHIGWNKILKVNESWERSPLKDVDDQEFMYFVHSYYAELEDQSNLLTATIYQDFEYCSSTVCGNIYGFQFHPEKSGEAGLKIYKNFLSI